MKKHRKHLAVCLGDHSGGPPRDIAPGKTPVSLFLENGKLLRVVDIDSRLTRAVRQVARREGVSVNQLLSAAVVDQFMKSLDGTEEA